MQQEDSKTDSLLQAASLKNSIKLQEMLNVNDI